MFCKCLKCIFSLFHVNASVSNFPEGHLDWFRSTNEFCLNVAWKLQLSYKLQMIDHKIVAASMRRLVCACDFETWAASMCLCHLNGERVFFAKWVDGFFNYRHRVMSVFIGNESLIELNISACLSRETLSTAQSAICYLCYNFRITACLNEWIDTLQDQFLCNLI